MKVHFTMGLHRQPGGHEFQVLLVGTVPTLADARNLQQWIQAALKEKSESHGISKGGIILPATMTDAKEVK